MGERSLIGYRQTGASVNASDSDDQLIARIRKRDLAAFEQMYRRYHPKLVRFLLNLTRRPTIADEVINDTMMVVWEKPDSFRGASKFSTWVFSIAYRKAMGALRKQDEAVEDSRAAERISVEAAPDYGIAAQRTHTMLADAMQALSADHRAVVDLTYFHEVGYREIAEIMACPVDTVKTRMFHARRHLKQMLAGGAADWL